MQIKCKRCGRSIQASDSVVRGYGRECATKEIHERKKRAIDYLEKLIRNNPFSVYVGQLDNAIDVIEDGAIHKTVFPGIYKVRSKRGDRNYLASVHGQCSCPHGVHRFRAVPGVKVDGTPKVDVCYHVGVSRVAEKFGILL
jgi:hypothetical protein